MTTENEDIASAEEDKMFTIEELLQPRTISEAAEMLNEYPGIVVLGGCGF